MDQFEQEEVLKVKESLKDSLLDSFTASSGWLENGKAAYGIRETLITGEVNDVSFLTVKSWIERIPELVKRLYAEGHMEHGRIGTIF